MFHFGNDFFVPDYGCNFLEGDNLEWYPGRSDLPVAGPSESQEKSPHLTPAELAGPSVTDLVTTPSPPTPGCQSDIRKYLRHLRLRFSYLSTCLAPAAEIQPTSASQQSFVEPSSIDDWFETHFQNDV